MSYTRQLLYSVADQIGRKREDLEPFITALQKNWYKTEQQLKSLTIEDFDHLDVPRRVSSVIMERLGTNFQKQKQMNKMNTMQMDIEISIPQLLEFLKKKTHEKVFAEMIDSLFRIFNNIRNSLIEEKYRSLKKSNKKIAELLKYKQNYELLKYGGFEDCETILLMKDVNLSRIDQCIFQLSKFHQSAKFDPYKAEIMTTNMKGLSLKEMEGQTSFVFTQRLAELERQRERIMSKPIQNRDIKFFLDKSSSESKTEKGFMYDERDQTEQERQYAARMKEKLMHYGEDPQFMNRRKQQYYDLMKKPIFSETLVRVKLPDNWIFQCKFSPLETLGDLVNIFHQYLSNQNIEYYLYMTPPVQKLRGIILRSTFYDTGCVPKAIFYFKTQEKVSGESLMKIKSNKLFGIF